MASVVEEQAPGSAGEGKVRLHEEPSAESLREIPEVDFTKVRIVGRGLKKDRRVTLKLLREVLGKTELDVAQTTGLDPSEVSRLEARADMKVSTLTRYAAAIGGEFEVAVVIGGRRYRLDV